MKENKAIKRKSGSWSLKYILINAWSQYMITITYQHGYKITYLQYYMLHYSNTHHTNLWEVMICFCPSQQPLLTRQSTNNINVILHKKCTLRLIYF